MENTTKTGTFYLPKTKIAWIVAVAVFTFILCRSAIMGRCFSVAISFIAYMVSQRSSNACLLIPAAAGFLTQYLKGYDVWGDFAAMAVCCLVFAAARKMRFALWQEALTAAAVSIICEGIYRLATVTVYQTSIEQLLLKGLLVGIFVFVFAAVHDVLKRLWAFHRTGMPGEGQRFFSREWEIAAFTIICILTIHGLGIWIALWPGVLFLGLWVLQAVDVGTALLVTAAGSASAALVEQGQWGVMVTAVMGLAAASFVKKHGAAAMALVFVLTCGFLQNVESGVVLGIDFYVLLPAAAVFLVVSWRFKGCMPRLFCVLAGREHIGARENSKAFDGLLKGYAAEMEELAQLYATYLDSRAMLANQFSIIKQIIDDIRWHSKADAGSAAERTLGNFHVEVAVSQCAALGGISGDCCGWQDMGDGRLAMVISDGMGKGKKAAAESLMVTKTLLALLKSGVTVELALKMINAIMLMKEEEDFYATVDLAMVDRRTGKARFYKIGAAPTLIRRKNHVEEVTLSTIPLGIVNGLKIQYMEAALKKDDWIIMMSDGVSDGGAARTGSSAFLRQIKEAAADARSPEPQIMSDMLVNRAADSYMGKERDDLTVIAAHIS